MAGALLDLSAIESTTDAADIDPIVKRGDGSVARARLAQMQWANISLRDRLRILRTARHAFAKSCVDVAANIDDGASATRRNLADSLVAEVLPLIEACRFLEREAASILRCRKNGRKGRPVWLRGVESEIHRVPLGVVLIIAPANYPLFLPGAQALQALAAGNAVLWKPAAGGESAARSFAEVFANAGLPKDVLQILDVTTAAGIEAIREGVDKVFLTGHADTGRAVLHETAEALTPSVMELSGCDAVFVLPGADLDRVVEAMLFGLRLNGSATCMAPRRVFASDRTIHELLQKLLPRTEEFPLAGINRRTQQLLDEIINDATRRGAVLSCDGRHGATATPTLVTSVRPDDKIMRTDVFAPLLAFCAVPDEASALHAHALCPYALTAAVFGPANEATAFAERIRAGTVLINDIIVSTADPRVPFGGRGASGFGVTRGREGLLEMTAVKTIIRQTSRSLRPYAKTGESHVPFFESFIQAIHSSSLRARMAGARKLIAAARNMQNSSYQQRKK